MHAPQHTIDYLLRARGQNVGALAFSSASDTPVPAASAPLGVEALERLLEVHRTVEQGEAMASEYRDLLLQGTSAGGARPKTTVEHEGRLWLSVAIDLATRCVVGFYLGMERPNAATVALLLSRVAQPKTAWLSAIRLDLVWPMYGLPKVLHLDNAAEFHSRALRTGCAQYGMELMYRPAGRPHFGGHVERLNRTLMERLKGLPGASGNSPKGRKNRKPEESAMLSLKEFERWLALEIGQWYHHSEHRGLMGVTPAALGWLWMGGFRRRSCCTDEC